MGQEGLWCVFGDRVCDPGMIAQTNAMRTPFTPLLLSTRTPRLAANHCIQHRPALAEPVTLNLASSGRKVRRTIQRQPAQCPHTVPQ
jgi:hypothetical protein